MSRGWWWGPSPTLLVAKLKSTLFLSPGPFLNKHEMPSGDHLLTCAIKHQQDLGRQMLFL
jgi:hypothetical protein